MVDEFASEATVDQIIRDKLKTIQHEAKLKKANKYYPESVSSTAQTNAQGTITPPVVVTTTANSSGTAQIVCYIHNRELSALLTPNSYTE